MKSSSAIVFCALLSVSWCDPVFPPGFKFGAGSSSYQVEGGWNASDKGVSIWDHFLHTKPSASSDGSNGDTSCDSYNLWRRDIEVAAELGLKFYRFSISWPRLLPNGFANHISEDGKNYYNNLIDGLLEKGVEPMVTIFHWELPQKLQELGGWTNPLITDWFADYARVVYSLYADRVRTWITINEPITFCDYGYVTGDLAPGIEHPDVGVYLCSKNVMIAHAKAWRIYHEEYKPNYHGKVAICNHVLLYEPATEDDEDLAKLAMQFVAGRYSHPIYSKEGGWPPSVENAINEYGAKLGYKRARLPAFTEEEIQLIKGTYDYYAANLYTSRVARRASPGETIDPLYANGIVEINLVAESRPDWPVSFSPLFYIYPEGMRKELFWLKENYGDIEVMITENGFTTSGPIDDQDRIQFINDHLEQIWLSIYEDGVNVTAYTYWSMMDSFEWTGNSVKFGLYAVNFTSPERTRTARASALYYANVIRNNAFYKLPSHG